MYITHDCPDVDTDFDALDYSYAHHRSNAAPVTTRGERRLWCAVIHQAFIDMLPFAVPRKRSIHNYRLSEHSTEKSEGKLSKAALDWLLNNQQDFTFVCSQAGVSPAVIRRAATIIARRYALI